MSGRTVLVGWSKVFGNNLDPYSILMGVAADMEQRAESLEGAVEFLESEGYQLQVTSQSSNPRMTAGVGNAADSLRASAQRIRQTAVEIRDGK
tara:strand:- start:910 stop:1188 length:279 start_codon:yes stop_codon:yes gene_type:complete